MSNLKIGKDSNIDSLINQSEISVVKFSATWCGPCRMFAPVIEKLSDKLAYITFVEIDVDDEEASSIVQSSSVSTVPLTVIYKNGEVKKRIVGFKPEEEMIKEIKEVEEQN